MGLVMLVVMGVLVMGVKVNIVSQIGFEREGIDQGPTLSGKGGHERKP